jgi:hypothetical protein
MVSLNFLLFELATILVERSIPIITTAISDNIEKREPEPRKNKTTNLKIIFNKNQMKFTVKAKESFQSFLFA